MFDCMVDRHLVSIRNLATKSDAEAGGQLKLAVKYSKLAFNFNRLFRQFVV